MLGHKLSNQPFFGDASNNAEWEVSHGVRAPPLGVRRTSGWRTVDVAPTIAALLGLPTPRQSEGVPIEPLLELANGPMRTHTLKDVYIQRQRLASTLTNALSVHLSNKEKSLLAATPPTEQSTLMSGINDLIQLHETILSRSTMGETLLSTLITITVGIIVLWLYISFVQRQSFADLRLAWHPVPGQYVNRRAFVFAFLGVLAFYIAAVALFLILLRIRGYTDWDSTVLHSPTELIVYLLDVIIPASLSAYILTRSFHFPFLVTAHDRDPIDEEEDDEYYEETPRSPGVGGGGADEDAQSDYSKYSDDDDATRRSGGSSAAKRAELAAKGRKYAPLSSLLVRSFAVSVEYLRCLCLGHAPVYSDLSLIYLIKVYVLGFSLLAIVILSIMQAHAYTFLLPQVLTVHFHVEASWTYRFQLLTMQLITLCLLSVSAASMVIWPAPDLSAAHFDRLYSLVLLKWERRRGPSAKSDDVLAMLEEETEALVASGYAPVLQREPMGDE